MIYLWVALGGALGSVARYWLNATVTTALGVTFPWGTLLINMLGSFIIGFFATLTLETPRFPVSQEVRVFVMVGLCGGFTTFSAFSLQTVELVRDGDWKPAGGYVAASVGLCLLLCWLGIVSALALGIRRG
jgi:CrcB protein